MRTVIVGGPRCGKSWLAADLSLNTSEGSGPLGTAQIYCGDPLSKVKEPMPTVHYLPEGLPFSGDNGAAQWIVDNWFAMPGPWVCEGHVMARALRRWMHAPEQYGSADDHFPCDRIIVLENHHPLAEVTGQQRAMHKGVMKVWSEIASYYHSITTYVEHQ